MIRAERDIWPYGLPYAAFLLIVQLESWLGPESAAWLLPLRVAVPAALLIHYARAGRYPELRGWPRRPAGVLGDVAVGLVIAAVWVAPYLAGWLPREGDPFDAGIYGEQGAALALGLRLAGYALVTPFMEELFVRSFLHRVGDAWARGEEDFLRIPVGTFTWVGFLLTSVWFTFTHVSWEWPVAAACGVIFNLWLYARRHIGGAIIAHAVANGAIWLAAVAGPVDLFDFL